MKTPQGTLEAAGAILGLGPSARSTVPAFIVMDVMEAAAAREAQGHKVIHMEVGQPGTPAPRAALDAARRSPVAVLLGWFPYALAGALLVATVALLTGVIDVSKPGSARLLAIAGIHQLTLAVLVILRGAWLARALRLASGHTPSRRFALLT